MLVSPRHLERCQRTRGRSTAKTSIAGDIFCKLLISLSGVNCLRVHPTSSTKEDKTRLPYGLDTLRGSADSHVAPNIYPFVAPPQNIYRGVQICSHRSAILVTPRLKTKEKENTDTMARAGTVRCRHLMKILRLPVTSRERNG